VVEPVETTISFFPIAGVSTSSTTAFCPQDLSVAELLVSTMSVKDSLLLQNTKNMKKTSITCIAFCLKYV